MDTLNFQAASGSCRAAQGVSDSCGAAQKCSVFPKATWALPDLWYAILRVWITLRRPSTIVGAIGKIDICKKVSTSRSSCLQVLELLRPQNNFLFVP